MSVRILSGHSEREIQTLVEEMKSAIYGQALSLQAQEKEIAELKFILLSSYRATRDLASGILVAEQEGIDVRDDLEQLVVELSDQIGLLEEHHVVL